MSTVIKRVIGLPGDTIQMRDGQVILNGTPVPKQRVADFAIPITPNYTLRRRNSRMSTPHGKPICRYPQFRETLPGGKSYEVLDRGDYPGADDTDVYSVPAGDVFVMGDNRDDSADSRFAPPQRHGLCSDRACRGQGGRLVLLDRRHRRTGSCPGPGSPPRAGDGSGKAFER